MKKVFLFAVICLLISLAGCYSQRPIAEQIPQNNKTYKIEYLFEHEGCKVYRFHDMGNWIYFTNCGGDVTAISNDSTATSVRTLGNNRYTENIK